MTPPSVQARPAGRRLPPAEDGLLFAGAWSLLSAAALLGLRSQLWRHVPIWSLPPAGMIEPLLSTLAGTGLALLLRVASNRGATLSAVIAAVALCYVPLAIVLRYADLSWSHVEVALSPLLGLALALVPFYVSSRRLRGLALAAVLVVVAGAGLVGAWPRLTGASTWFTVDSSLYELRVDVFPSMADASTMTRGGAIEPYGDRYVLAAADGSFYDVGWGEGRLRSRRMALHLPLERERFAAAQQANGSTFDLRVTDMLIDRATQPPMLVVAHQHWDEARRCMTLRISRAPLQPASPSVAWQTVFETTPCLELGAGYDDLESGGRLAWHRDGLLLSVGDMRLTRAFDPPLSQRHDGSYGKVLRIAPDGTSTIFTMGHRNPQGLFVDTDGTVWESEQGPRGGDEINRLIDGSNYGWPWATYGTDYDSRDWGLLRTDRDHGEFTEPQMAFVPSMALSNLLRVHSARFPAWQHDLLAGSLTRRSLVRVRLRGDRAILAEPIPIGYRIRDMVEDPSGRLLLWTDERSILVVTPTGAAQ